MSPHRFDTASSCKRTAPDEPWNHATASLPGAICFATDQVGYRVHEMAVVLGINAVFHDPSAALVIDGKTVACAEEERFSRRKHGKPPVPFATWELPESAARWCLSWAGVGAEDLDAVAYSYDPALAQPATGDLTAHGWEGLRTLYAARAPRFLGALFPD